jgi:hypothetical protein
MTIDFRTGPPYLLTNRASDESVELEFHAILLTPVSNSEQSNHIASIVTAPDLLTSSRDGEIA